MKISSSLLGRTNVIGFYIDCFIVVGGAMANFTAIFLFGTIHTGIFLYINGMVKDMKMRINAINVDSSEKSHDSMKAWLNYVREIRFHIEIIKYDILVVTIEFKSIELSDCCSFTVWQTHFVR